MCARAWLASSYRRASLASAAAHKRGGQARVMGISVLGPLIFIATPAEMWAGRGCR